MKQSLLIALLFFSSIAFGQTKRIPAKYYANIKYSADPFTGVETFNYASPTFAYVVKDGSKAQLLLKIAVQRAVTQPEISKILIKCGNRIFEIPRNEREFRTREIADVKDTEEEKTKVVKQRNAQRVFIDEFVGSYDDHEELFKELMINSATIRIEGNVEIADQKSTDKDRIATRKLYELYLQFKERE